MQDAVIREAAEAEAKEKAAVAADEAQMKAAMALSLELTVPDGQRMAQVRATEVTEFYEAQREAERTEAARVESEQLNARDATEIAARAAESRATRTRKAEQLVGPAGVPEQKMLLQQAAQVMEHGLQLQQNGTDDRC